MMTNPITNFAKANNLKVASIDLADLNSIIFKTKYVKTLSGASIVKDGDKVFKLDIVSNDAVEITPASITKSAVSAFLDGKVNDDSNVAVQYGLVKKLVLTTADTAVNSASSSIRELAKLLKLDVLEVEVKAQNAIIFQTQGVKQLSGLDIYDGKYFKLDTVANTATVIDADGIAAQATKDIIAGKSTELTDFVLRYNLVKSLTLGTAEKATAQDDNSADA